MVFRGEGEGGITFRSCCATGVFWQNPSSIGVEGSEDVKSSDIKLLAGLICMGLCRMVQDE